MENLYCLDWFSGTKLSGPLVFDTAFPNGLGQIVSAAKPRNGYNRADMLACGAVVMHHDAYRDMGYHIQLDGGSLRELRMAGMTDTAIVRKLSSMSVRASRIDLAMDLFGSASITVPGVANAFERGAFKCVARKGTYTHGVGTENKGATLYIGGRQSERMLRVYNKASEMGIDNMHWTRFEFELKDEQAHAVQGVIVVNPTIADAFRAVWNSFVRVCEDSELSSIVGTTSATIPDIPRKAHSTIAWLLDQVVPAMVNFADSHPEIDVLELINNAYKSYKG